MASASASALDPEKALTQYTHQVWRAEEGLPQNSVQAIAQTRDGYLWLGTQEGLVRFDGVRFVVFDEKNAPVLKNTNVLALCAGANGDLWIGTRGGGLVRLSNGVFTQFLKSEGLPNDFVRSVFEDSRGRLWVGTEGGLARLEQGRFVPVHPLPAASSPEVVLAIAESGDDMWLGTDGAGLLRLRGQKTESFTRKDGLPSDVIRCLHADPDGTLWIGTRGGGLVRLRRGQFTSFPTQGGVWNTIGSGAIHRDRDGNLWVGTRGGGLLRLHGEEIAAFTKKDGLGSDIVMCVYEDREGTLWVGTDGEGLHRFKNGKVTTFSVQEGLPNNMLLPIYEDRRGTLWLGSYGGGLAAMRDGRFSSYTTAQGLVSDMIASLAGDGAGNLWIGTDGGGLDRFRDGRFTHYAAAQGLSSNRVISLLVDREGNLWVGTYGGGLDLMQGEKFLVYGKAEGLTNQMINALTQDREGNLWIGTDGGGLNRFRDGRFHALTTRDGLAHDTVYRIYEDTDGVLWIGSFAGLSRFKNGKFTTYTTQNGLFDNKIFQILEDDDGNLWMSCNKGIFRVSKKQLNDFAAGTVSSITSTAFGKADGMKSSECNGTSQPAGWKSRDGTLWFPTTIGAVRIDPRHLVTNSVAPPVSIEDVIIDKKHLSGTGALRALPGAGELEIHYAALSLVDAEKVRFRYRLEGFDSAWVDPGTRRTAFYTNTPPGHYRFRVIACNNDGLWNEEGSSIEITLEPHFYQTLWFYGLCALGVALIGFGSHTYRVRSLTRRKRELIRLVSERTQQLEDANAILRRLSAQDGLTGIANRRHFDEELLREWRRSARSHQPLSLLMIDIDSFKSYNDLYGHQQGDDCLKKVASTLQELLKRPGDLCARYGGEEFAIILPATRCEGAAQVAETLRAGIEALAIPHAKSSTGIVTVSIGASCASSFSAEEPPSLIARSDVALYRAKQEGRNRVCMLENLPPGVRLPLDASEEGPIV
jgi:diguanylate cyclase (GGDEF)-like protein